MYNKTTLVIVAIAMLIGAQSASAVEESAFSVGDQWAFGQEINLIEEMQSEITELETEINSELIESDEAGEVRNMTGIGLESFELANQAVLGFFYTGEVIDDFDQMVHMQTEQSMYSHTVFGTRFSSTFPTAGIHDLRLQITCSDETEDCEEYEMKILDNNTLGPLSLEQLDTELSGSMHYVAKITQDTWWTKDTHDLARAEFTVELGAAGGITIKNIPNITMNGASILEDTEPEYECANGYQVIEFWFVNDGWDDCDDGSDEPGNGYDFTCDNGDTYPLSYVNDGTWDCENGEDEGAGNEEPFQACEEMDNGSVCYETIDVRLETAIFEMAADASINLAIDFGDDPMNALDLPLEENKYWEGELSSVTISGDIGGKIDVKKPELSLCPELDCDQLPEMQELYSALTEEIDNLHDAEDFSVTVDRDNDGLPDVITEWDDLFPMYIPETWMDQIFQEMLNQIACDDEESAQEGEECDETAEEEFEKLDLRIENNRFAFGPYSIPTEETGPLPYSFETGELETASASDGTTYEGYQVFPTDPCSENNPDRDSDDCDGEEGEETPFPSDSRSGHDGEDHCNDEDIFCDSEVVWFHDAETGHPAYINMNMPNLGVDGYVTELTPIETSVADALTDANADANNPKKTTLIEFNEDEIPEDPSSLPGFGAVAVGISLLFVSRRFRA